MVTNTKIKTTPVLILIALMAGWLTSGAQGIEFIHDKKFQELLDMAKKQDKVIFMDCYTSWCGPCKRLASTVFPDSAVGEYFNRAFINTKFDMEKDEGITIANRYGIRAYPTLLWLDGDGNVKHKIVGGLDPAGLIQNGKKAIDPTPGILTRMRKQYADGDRSASFLCEYVNTLYDASEKYDEVFKTYLEKLVLSDFTDAKHAKTIFNLTNDVKSPGIPYLMKNKDYYRHLLGDETFNTKINQLAPKAAADAPRADDKAMFTTAMALLKSNKAPDEQEKTLKISMDYYSRMGDWVNYDKNATQYIKKFGAKDARLLNDVAWDYYLNIHDEAQLEKAAKWAYQSINLDNKYTYNLTYAYLLYKLNNFKEAEKACDYAIIRAKAENVNPSSANSLKEYIKKSMPQQQKQ
jgi:thiol-disulfide isomerase/thioredoxin